MSMVEFVSKKIGLPIEKYVGKQDLAITEGDWYIDYEVIHPRDGYEKYYGVYELQNNVLEYRCKVRDWGKSYRIDDF